MKDLAIEQHNMETFTCKMKTAIYNDLQLIGTSTMRSGCRINPTGTINQQFQFIPVVLFVDHKQSATGFHTL